MIPVIMQFLSLTTNFFNMTHMRLSSSNAQPVMFSPWLHSNRVLNSVTVFMFLTAMLLGRRSWLLFIFFSSIVFQWTKIPLRESVRSVFGQTQNGQSPLTDFYLQPNISPFTSVHYPINAFSPSTFTTISLLDDISKGICPSGFDPYIHYYGFQLLTVWHSAFIVSLSKLQHWQLKSSNCMSLPC